MSKGSVDISIPRSEQKKFEKELERFRKRNNEEFDHRVEQATLAASKMASRNAPVGEGDLSQEIYVETVGSAKNGQITGNVISPMQHSASVEYGSKPHMPPVNALIEWSKRKNINPWAVAMSIKRKGTPAQPFFYPAWNKAQRDLMKGLRRHFR